MGKEKTGKKGSTKTASPGRKNTQRDLPLYLSQGLTLKGLLEMTNIHGQHNNRIRRLEQRLGR